jgi:chemotaxis-related protein WspD
MEPREKNQQPAAAQKTATLTLAEPAARNLADCWNQIGVAGDGSCVELARVVHCRNCSVYAAAGVKLLDRPLPVNYRRDWTEHFAHEKKRAAAAWISVVVFRIGAEWLALPTRAFREVAERRRVHSLPHRRHGIVLGVVSVRGELLVCVSLERLLGIKSTHPRILHGLSHGRLVVSEWHDGVLTFPVDEIHGIHRYQAADLQPAPASVAHADSNFTTGLFAWSGNLVGCLDADRLFSSLNRSLA